jgi:hypothetical protein
MCRSVSADVKKANICNVGKALTYGEARRLFEDAAVRPYPPRGRSKGCLLLVDDRSC